MNAVAGSEPPVRLADGLDLRAIAAVFARTGRVHIPGILADDVARRIHRCMTEETPWSRVLNDQGKHYDLGPGTWEAMPESARAEILRRIAVNGRRSFQYFYENFPLADLHAAGRHLDSYLMRVYEFIGSAAFLEFARRATGIPTLATADAQATRYGPGDFLTRHDDRLDEKRRRVAYVFNFTPEWLADWGGLLLFLDRDGHVAEGYVPAFNALNLLRVPQPHTVSLVAPLAAGARYSITGWLRDG